MVPGPELVLIKHLLLLPQSSQKKQMVHRNEQGLRVEGRLRAGW